MSTRNVAFCLRLTVASLCVLIAIPTRGGDAVVLDTYSYWTRFVVFRPIKVAVPQTDAASKPEDDAARRRAGEISRLESSEISYQAEHLGFFYSIKAASPLPPTNWMQPEFDDAAWWRSPGPWFPGHGNENVGYSDSVPGWSNHAALLCLRGRFYVEDPAAAKNLRLLVKFRGGIVVYVNGKEAARGHLPEGEINFETLAEPYPQEAYLTADGKVLPPIGAGLLYGLSNYGAEQAKKALQDHNERYAKRFRALEDVPIPSTLLKKGVNILALEIHRAPHNPIVADPNIIALKERGAAVWLTAGLIDVRLTAEANGAVARCGRPSDLQVWNAFPFRSVFDVDYGDEGRDLAPLRIVGTRNGAFSGQVVVGSRNPIRGLKAAATGLARKDGAGSIAASAIDIRYPQPNTTEHGLSWRYPVSGIRRFDVLERTAPPEVPVREKKPGSWASDAAPWPCGAVQPVWVQIRIPADAAAGDYTGSLTITAEGENAITTPIHLRVCPWKLPAPEDFETIMDFLQSPWWNAEHYKVEPWSDKHWDLIAETLKILYTIGNRTVYIPLIGRTHLEHDEPIVRCVKEEGGKYSYDFTLMDRYLDLVQKYMPSARIVVLIVFDQYMQPRRTEDAERTPGAPWITVLDPKTGKTERTRGPTCADPEAEALWEPLIRSARERLRKRGLDTGTVLGLVNDYGTPDDQTVAFWKKLCPDLGWLAMGHGIASQYYKQAKKAGGTQAYGVSHAGSSAMEQGTHYCGKDIYPYGCRHGWDRPKPWDKEKRGERFILHRRRGDPDADFPVLFSGRDFLSVATPMRNHRLAAEFNIQGDQSGVGFQPADWWYEHFSRGGGGIRGGYDGTFTRWNNNGPTSRKLDPGPDGALSTVRFEMMREGVQECEARIFIEKALLDKDRRARLGEELAARCERLIIERTRSVLRSIYNYAWYSTVDWNNYAEELFNTAAAVADALAARK